MYYFNICGGAVVRLCISPDRKRKSSARALPSEPKNTKK
jgi:hypothetical protein